MFDHALLLPNDSDSGLIESLRKLNPKLLLITYENMLIDFKTRLQKATPEIVEMHSLKLWETQHAFVKWFASDQV